ncbi:MAG: Arm DNA-binding domain-containing protein, partial [Burkholderiaceae bacterium]|nr:Arm DNA-binding domain-containing protein [Burkholderiaceae bacterium]
MPIKAKELSAIAVKRLSDVGYHAVGGVAGLHLQVSSTGAKSWILRYTTGEILTSKSGKQFYRRRDLGLGGYPDVTLEQARNKAREAKEK